jgi:hypothetical protein
MGAGRRNPKVIPFRRKGIGALGAPELIGDEGCWQLSLGVLRVFAGPEDELPPNVDALVVEEDTYLVLGSDLEIQESEEDLEELMSQAIEDTPQTPGSVLVKERNPFRFLAIIHDLNQEPTWKEEWIAGALNRVFRLTERHRIKSLALPVLGTVHGSLEKKRFLALLHRAMDQASLTLLKELRLIVPSANSHEILAMLESEFRS